MNKKQWNTFGGVSLVLAGYFYIWSIMDSIAGFNADIQRFIFMILLGLSIAFFSCSRFERAK